MPLVDTSILSQMRQPVQSPLQSIQGGVQMRDALDQSQQQRTAYTRQQAFMSALDEEVKKVDYTKPEGQQALVQGLANKGFGQEAMELAKQFPKQTQEFIPTETDQGMMAFNKATGQANPITRPDGSAVYSDKIGKEKEHKTKYAAFQNDLANEYGPAAAAIGTDVGKRNALVSKIYQKYGDLPEAQKFIDDTKNTPAATFALTSGVIAPRDRLRLENNFRTDWVKENQAYEKQAGPFINIMSAKKSKGYGTGIGDQALVDDFVSFQSKGSKPTSAQYKEAMSSYGLGDLFDKISGRLRTGAKLPPQVREDIMNTVQSQMADYHQRHLDLKEEKSRQLEDSGGDPKRVFNSAKYENTIGQYLTPSDANPATVPTVKTKEERDKLPPGSQYIGPDGHLATVPK